MPIGNIDDLTIRMVDSFKNCDVIFSDNEPNRTHDILKKYKLDKPVVILNSTDSRFADKN
jgi:16S rRNA C1402 (ribose-2'-O) methylase RsmI